MRGVEEEEMGVWGEKSDRKCGDSRVREWIGWVWDEGSGG